jgi:hypothetical protein
VERRGDNPVRELRRLCREIRMDFRETFSIKSRSPFNPRRQKRLEAFFKSPFTWGSIAMLAGAPNNPWAKGLVLASLISLLVSVWKVNFFRGPIRYLEVLGSSFISVVLCLAYLGIWNIIPRPQKPLTSDEQAIAVLAAECKIQPQRCKDSSPPVPSTTSPANVNASELLAKALLKIEPKQTNLADSLSNPSLSTLAANLSKRLDSKLDDLFSADNHIEGQERSGPLRDERFKEEIKRDRADIRASFLMQNRPLIVEANQMRNTMLDRLGRKGESQPDSVLISAFNWGAYQQLAKDLESLSLELK